MTNMPQIQNFYGNTDFNNWIANCKPFKPNLNVNDMYVPIKTIEVSEALKQLIDEHQKAWNDIFNYKWL